MEERYILDAKEKKQQGKVLKVFRLETNSEVPVSELGTKVQSVRADFMPLDSEGACIVHLSPLD